MFDMGGSGMGGAGGAPPSATSTGTFSDSSGCNVADTPSATSASRSKDTTLRENMVSSLNGNGSGWNEMRVWEGTSAWEAIAGLLGLPSRCYIISGNSEKLLQTGEGF